MEKIDTKLMAKLNNMIDEAIKAEEYKLATALGNLQIEIIEERTKAWEIGYDAGFSMGIRKSALFIPRPNPWYDSINHIEFEPQALFFSQFIHRL